MKFLNQCCYISVICNHLFVLCSRKSQLHCAESLRESVICQSTVMEHQSSAPLTSMCRMGNHAKVGRSAQLCVV